MRGRGERERDLTLDPHLAVEPLIEGGCVEGLLIDHVGDSVRAAVAGPVEAADQLTDSTLGDHVELGYSVAISSDGDTIVAGAPAGSEIAGNGVNSQGTVDVFTTTGNWTSTSTPAARLAVAGSPATESSLGGELGWSVAISGTTIVAGAPYDATYPSYGEAYVFVRPPGGWVNATQTARLSASNPSNPDGDEYFGWSVGVSGTTIVVGAYAQEAKGGYACT
jgi:FG-GAP repeat